MSKTLKLVLPEWQGGMNPDYQLGAQLMNLIVPTNNLVEEVQIPVRQPADTESQQSASGIEQAAVLGDQLAATKHILATKNPINVITIGGDCAVSLAPFDYLSGKYGDELGILWLDAHPDISTPDQSHHLHEMVVSTLLGKGATDFNDTIIHPVSNEHVLLAGLIKERLRPMDQHVFDYHVPFITPNAMRIDPQFVRKWLDRTHINKLAVHLDLDVFAPTDFRSIYPGEPHTDPAKFQAAVGQMRLAEVFDLLADLEQVASIVGLTFAEHMPWDALNLRKNLGKLSLFNA